MITSAKCNCCQHEKVCGVKEEYSAACEAIKSAGYSTKSGYMFIGASPFDVSIRCPHIMTASMTRKGAVNE